MILERDGVPKVDPLFGGRFWPGVVAFLNRRYGLSRVEASALDGQENLDAF